MENLLKCKGRMFTAKIRDTEVKGRIQVEGNTVYLCQDEKDGGRCSDKLGCKYSWVVRHGSPDDLMTHGVSDFRLISLSAKEIQAYKDWQIGDRLVWHDYKRIVIFRSGELVVCKESNNNIATNNFTCDELYDRGWRLDAIPQEPEPVILELTLDQIAEKFNTPVSSLKIKKE